MRTRKCISSGELLPESALLRFAVSPDGEVVPDVRAQAPGRGLWVRADAQALELAVRKNSFARAAKAKVRVPPDLQARTEAALESAALDLLGLARRAGELVCGFEKVRSLLGKTRPACLVEAADGAPDGRGKLLALARGKWGDVVLIDCFTRAQLGPPVGRAASTHMALLDGGLARKFCFHAQRLCAIRLLFHEH